MVVLHHIVNCAVMSSFWSAKKMLLVNAATLSVFLSSTTSRIEGSVRFLFFFPFPEIEHHPERGRSGLPISVTPCFISVTRIHDKNVRLYHLELTPPVHFRIEKNPNYHRAIKTLFWTVNIMSGTSWQSLMAFRCIIIWALFAFISAYHLWIPLMQELKNKTNCSLHVFIMRGNNQFIRQQLVILYRSSKRLASETWLLYIFP